MTNLTNIDIGKIPPQAIEMEEAVLGAILIEPNVFDKLNTILKPTSFYRREHEVIYEACKMLYDNMNPIDIITVPEQLRKMDGLDEVGGVSFITRLSARVSSSVHAEYHAQIVQQKFIQREFIRIASEIARDAYDDSIEVEGLIEFAEKQILAIADNTNFDIHNVCSIVNSRLELFEMIEKSDNKFTGVPTGHIGLDSVLHGFQKQDLIILAARPSIGKSQMMLHFVFHAAMNGYKILIFTLEMSKEQLTERLMSIASKINPMKAKRGKLTLKDWKILRSSIKKFVDTKIIINEKPGLTISEVRSISRRVKRDHNIDEIFIDYMQLMTGERTKNSNREQEVSSISRGLKGIAKEINVPVIALSQLNRDADNQVPTLRHLRESGAIEQDADVVVFIHRDKSTETNEFELRGDFIIAKHRNGAIGGTPFYLDSVAMTTLFSSVEEQSIVDITGDIDDLPY